MKAIYPLLLTLALLAPAQLRAQEPQSRVLATSLGLLAGAAGGGYLTVSVVVLEARFGRYVEDLDDILGWRSAPFLVGAALGAGLGFYSPERLQGAVVWGAAGLGAGALLGGVVGTSIWNPPEGRWAGAAIGAGIGLVIGNTIGVMNPMNLFTEGEDATAATAGVPITIRIPL
ncbi:MAG TPA: hypothetical protein VFZ24_17810 [Longimicrobiales bacterium]